MTDETTKVESEPRSCANCACSHTMDHPQFGKQLFCRRDPANAQEFNVQQPIIRNGQPVMDKRDPTKPMMSSGRALFYLYKPTLPALMCFDGWRPIGTQPGEKWQNLKVDGMMEGIVKNYERLSQDVSASLSGESISRDLGVIASNEKKN